MVNFTSDSSASVTDELVKTLENQYSVRGLAAQADLGTPNGPAHLVTLAKNHFSHPKTGKFQIDIIVHNAGIATAESIADTTPETFHRLYDIMVLGPLLLMKAAMPYLPHDRSGRIVGMSSVSAVLGFPGQSAYAGCKAALEAMTRTWARELADRATCNCVNPGPVATDMYKGVAGSPLEDTLRPHMLQTPLAKVTPEHDAEELVAFAKQAGGRPATPEEIAGVVGMLCTPDGAWCTGSVVNANGGMIFGR